MYALYQFILEYIITSHEKVSRYVQMDKSMLNKKHSSTAVYKKHTKGIVIKFHKIQTSY